MNTKQQINTPCFLLLLFLAFFGVQPSLWADDTKIYNGYHCRNGKQGRNTIYYTSGMALNYSPNQELITCSVVKDAKNIIGATIRVIDESLPQNNISSVVCYLQSSIVESGDPTIPPQSRKQTFKYDSRKVTTYDPYNVGGLGSGGLVFTEDFFLANPAPMVSNNSATHYIDCYVPGLYNGKASGIVSYSITEKD